MKDDPGWTIRRSPEGVVKQLTRAALQGRARQRLIEAHRDEYEQMLDEEYDLARVPRRRGR